MNIIDSIKDSTIIITSNSNKEYILTNINKMLNIKFMTKDEFISHYYFDYNEDTIIYLMNKYNIKYDIALVYLKNIYYIENNSYNEEKIKKLIDIKKDLIENKKLIYDKYFSNYIKNKNIIIYGYTIDKYLEKIIYENNIQLIKEDPYKNDFTIYKFENIEEEINYVSEQIIDLLNKNIDINNIKLVVNEDYLNTIDYIFNIYNIPINIKSTNNIYSLPLIKDFLNLLKNNKSIEKSLEIIENKYNLNDINIKNIYNKLINIINNYIEYDIKDIIKCLEYKFNNTKLDIAKIDNAINIININEDIITIEDHIFILGFNSNTYPKIEKDIDYLNDILKEKLDITPSYEQNMLNKNHLLNKLKSISNLYISYSQESSFNKYFPSSLIEELNANIIDNYQSKHSYSNLINKLELSKLLDNYNKYGTINNNLNLLYNNYKNIEYLIYDNKYHPINKDNLLKYLNNKLSLSYSSINNYYKCSFKYYLSNILYLNDNEETFDLFIGNLFHYILSIAFNETFNYEIEFNNYIKKRKLTNKEEVFIDKLKKELLFIINTIKDNLKYTSFDKALYEEKIIVNIPNNIKVTLTGIIDKVMYKIENDITYLAIIDYKTGNPDIDLNNSIYGINMQLPIYLYLMKNNNKVNNIKISGIYYQKILSNEKINKDGNKTYEQIKRDNLKLIGYSNSDMNILEKFDNSYNDSKVVKSLKTTENGFYAYSKVLSNEEFNKLISICEDNIDKSINRITTSEFDINPKVINNKQISCNYCEYKDICYKTYKDEVVLKENKDLEFL